MIQLRTALTVIGLALFGSTLGACGVSGLHPVPGKTSEAQARALLNPIVREERSKEYPQALVLYSKDGQAAQIEDGVTVAYFRDPTETETQVQYWRHQWVDQTTRLQAMESTKDPHGHMLYEFAVPALGKSVFYDRTTGVVRRVVEMRER